MTRRLRSLTFAATLGASLALLTGCPTPTGSDAGGDGGDGDIDPNSFDSHGCDHMEFGPPTEATAVAAASDGPPMVSSGHRRTDITLADIGGGERGGVVMFDVGMTEAITVYLNSDVGLTVMQNGSEVAPNNTDPNDLCPELIVYRGVFELEEGTAMFTFGPTDATSVSMVARGLIDDMGGHSHADGGHGGHMHGAHDGGHMHGAHDGGHMHGAHDGGQPGHADGGHMVHDGG
jgi:hypothetical protein